MIHIGTNKLYKVSSILCKVYSFTPVNLARWKEIGLFEKSVNSVLNNTSCYPSKFNMSTRQYCTEGGDKTTAGSSFPTLMDFPEIVWPSIIKTVRNWILANFIIRPYFDNEFNLPDFVVGSKQALQIVSTKLAGNEFNDMDGLLASETIVQLRKAISSMSVSQRQELAISKDDVYFSFPYQIGVIFDESSSSSQRRWVEITMCYHVLKGLKEMVDQGHNPPINMGMLPEYTEKITICNYRFLREFTKGVESQWIVNVVNHFKPTVPNRV